MIVKKLINMYLTHVSTAHHHSSIILLMHTSNVNNSCIDPGKPLLRIVYIIQSTTVHGVVVPNCLGRSF